MRMKMTLCMLVIIIGRCMSLAQEDDPAKKLRAFLGKWKSEATFTGSDNKVTSALECRWSPQGVYLVCEQVVKMAGGDHRQLTVYSYNAKDGNYSFATISDPGAKPASGTVQINGYVWVYSSSFEANGKTTQMRTTNEFTTPSTETFKTESSDDGGATWKTLLQGTAHKTGA
jgi:Protein of unknown function (DUF1579)